MFGTCWYLWPFACFCTHLMFNISFCCCRHNVSNIFVQLTEGRSARDQPKQPPAKKNLPFLFTRVLCSLWKYHRAPIVASALRLEGMNCLAAEPPLHLHLARQCTHGSLRANIQLANDFISRACGTQFLGEMRTAFTDWLAWTEGYAQSR